MHGATVNNGTLEVGDVGNIATNGPARSANGREIDCRVPLLVIIVPKMAVWYIKRGFWKINASLCEI